MTGLLSWLRNGRTVEHTLVEPDAWGPLISLLTSNGYEKAHPWSGILALTLQIDAAWNAIASAYTQAVAPVVEGVQNVADALTGDLIYLGVGQLLRLPLHWRKPRRVFVFLCSQCRAAIATTGGLRGKPRAPGSFYALGVGRLCDPHYRGAGRYCWRRHKIARGINLVSSFRVFCSQELVAKPPDTETYKPDRRPISARCRRSRPAWLPDRTEQPG